MKKMNSTYFWNRVTLELLPKQNSNFYWNDKFYIFFFFFWRKTSFTLISREIVKSIQVLNGPIDPTFILQII